MILPLYSRACRQLVSRPHPSPISVVRRHPASPTYRASRPTSTNAPQPKITTYKKTTRSPRHNAKPGASVPRPPSAWSRVAAYLKRAFGPESSFWIQSWPIVKAACITGAISVFCIHYIASIRPSAGPSMLPTLATRGDRVLISYLHPHVFAIRAGDLVSFTNPMDGGRNVKRVIGMPGDLVLRDTPPGVADNFWIEADVPRWEREGRGDHGPGWMVRVPPGHCWVVGDNLPWSRDSRHFGALPLNLVVGKVLCRVLPWKHRAWFGSNSAYEDIDVAEPGKAP